MGNACGMHGVYEARTMQETRKKSATGFTVVYTQEKRKKNARKMQEFSVIQSARRLDLDTFDPDFQTSYNFGSNL